MKIKDSLKKQRLEWIFGIPQVVSKINYRMGGGKRMQYGSEACDMISDEYYTFKSGCFKGVTNAYLGQIMQQKGRIDTQCILSIRALVEMMLEDDEVAWYVFNQPSPTM